jgi:Flp pilus assembly protein TadB
LSPSEPFPISFKSSKFKLHIYFKSPSKSQESIQQISKSIVHKRRDLDTINMVHTHSIDKWSLKLLIVFVLLFVALAAVVVVDVLVLVVVVVVVVVVVTLVVVLLSSSLVLLLSKLLMLIVLSVVS